MKVFQTWLQECALCSRIKTYQGFQGISNGWGYTKRKGGHTLEFDFWFWLRVGTFDTLAYESYYRILPYITYILILYETWFRVQNFRYIRVSRLNFGMLLLKKYDQFWSNLVRLIYSDSEPKPKIKLLHVTLLYLHSKVCQSYLEFYPGHFLSQVSPWNPLKISFSRVVFSFNLSLLQLNIFPKIFPGIPISCFDNGTIL